MKSDWREDLALTIVNNLDGLARGQNGENPGITEASGVFGVVLNLQEGTETLTHRFVRYRDARFTLAPLKDS